MTSVALLFVGAVLLINGLTFCGLLDGRAGVPANVLVGALLLAAAVASVVEAGGLTGYTRIPLYSAAGFVLFSFTYLGVAGQSLLRTDGRSLGVYCGWSALVAAVLAAVNMYEAVRMGWLWLAWTVLFFAFALALLTDRAHLGRAAGVLSIWLAVTSATLPGLLMIDGSWDRTPVWAVAAAQLLGVIAYGSLSLTPRRRPRAGAEDRPGGEHLLSAAPGAPG